MSVNGIGVSGGPGGANGPKGPGDTGGPKRPPPSGDSKVLGAPKKPDLLMNKLLKIIHAEPEIRNDLVAEYKNLIRSGKFKMGAEELTSRILIESMQEFKS